MNNDLAMNEIRIAEETVKKIDEAKRGLLFSLETINELKRIQGAAVKHPIQISLSNGAMGASGLRIDGLFTQEELYDMVITRAEKKARAAYEALKKVNNTKIEDEAKAEPKAAPESEPKEKEEHTPRMYIDHDLVTELYFKQGLNVQQIVEKTGYGLSSVYKHIQQTQKARMLDAKERARQRH